MNRKGQPFTGFEPLTANYVYCPNQFFDVCLPNCSRGAIRIVAYLLRETLGYVDENGNPKRQNITVSFRDLIEKSGVSRGAIATALKEAIDGGFIICRRSGQQKVSGKSGQSAVYSLRWDGEGKHTKSPDAFAGFYAGDGYRSPIPNRFFDHVVPHESLSVIKVVGTVIRHTVGYQNQFGGRRSEHPLSYSFIQQYANIGGRANLANAIKQALKKGYIKRVADGCVHPSSEQRVAATYSIRWLGEAAFDDDGSKSKPAASDRFKNGTSNGSKIAPADRFKNETNKTTVRNNSNKDCVAGDCQRAVRLLIVEGIASTTAQKLVQKRGLEVVQNQLAWLDARDPENRAAMLSKAVEENWDKPRVLAERDRRRQRRQQERKVDAEQADKDEAINVKKKARAERKRRLLDRWQQSSSEERQRWIQAAAERETSRRIADPIRRQSPETAEPQVQVLDVLAIDAGLPQVIENKQ